MQMGIEPSITIGRHLIIMTNAIHWNVYLIYKYIYLYIFTITHKINFQFLSTSMEHDCGDSFPLDIIMTMCAGFAVLAL